jgi:hypothetical protein
MKTLELNGREILAVECENPNATLHIHGNNMELHWARHAGNGKFLLVIKKLPSGQWQILGRPSEITEEVARGLVESKEVRNRIIYLDYTEPTWWYKKATESLLSWCRANGIENELLILKNK